MRTILYDYIGYSKDGKTYIVDHISEVPSDYNFKKNLKTPNKAIAKLVFNCDWRNWKIMTFK